MPGKAVTLERPPSFIESIPPEVDKSLYKQVPEEFPKTGRYYNIQEANSFKRKISIAVPIKGRIKYNYTIHKYEVELSSLFYAYESLAEEIPKGSSLKQSVDNYFSSLRKNYSDSELKVLFGELNPTKYYINESDIAKFISTSKDSIEQGDCH